MEGKIPNTPSKVKETVDYGDAYEKISVRNLEGNTITVAKKKRFLKAFEQTMGVISQACKIAKIPNRSVVNYWKDTDPVFKAIMENQLEDTKDFAEASAKAQIRDKNTIMTLAYLKMHCRDRGWVEVNTNTNININKDAGSVENMSDEQLMAIIKGEK